MLLAVHTVAVAHGVTPYLPLNLEPEIEAQIERVLILAGKPVMRRPIAAATVLDALPKACRVDQARRAATCVPGSRLRARRDHLPLNLESVHDLRRMRSKFARHVERPHGNIVVSVGAISALRFARQDSQAVDF
jgi:hypothetical protein